MNSDATVGETIKKTMHSLSDMLERQPFPHTERVLSVLLTGTMMTCADHGMSPEGKSAQQRILANILATHPNGQQIFEILKEFLQCQI